MQCKNCGAQIILDKLEFAKECQYCGSPVVSEIDELPGLKPDAVIPFKFDGVEAVKKFNIGVRKKWFLPNEFKKEPPTDNINGIYVPSFAFDSNTNSSYNGVLVKDHTHTNSKGQTTTTHEYIRIAANKLLNFTNVTIESSSKIENKDMKALLPYQLNFNWFRG